MGVVQGISHNKFPQQTTNVGRSVLVTFWYQFDQTIAGTMVREDFEAPHETIIQLEDGRYVLGEECQYRYVS